MNEQELRKKLAAIEHERWSDWQAWCHKILRENCPSPELEKVLERWDRQIATPYDKLSDSEKASDMEQVDRYWPLIAALVARREAEAYKFARAAVLASPVAISGQHIGGLPGGMPHVADRQVDTQGPNKLPVYATTYAMRDFILDQLDKKIAALTTEATQGEKEEQ